MEKPELEAAKKYAHGRCKRGQMQALVNSSFYKNTVATFLAGAAWQKSEMVDYLKTYRRAYDESLCPPRKLEEFDGMLRTVVAFHMGRFLLDNMLKDFSKADAEGERND
jgi:hypothetical protein